MYIVRKEDLLHAEPGEREPHHYSWHVGDRRPTKNHYPFEDVTEVYADGDELDWVRQNYSNLPLANHCKGMVWRGDLAQFIYDHMPTYAGRASDETSHYRSE